MGAKVTTEIDPYIKQLWEIILKDKGITFKDILEEGIISKVADIDPIKAEEVKIMQLEFQLSDHKMHLATLKVSAEQAKEKSAGPQLEMGIEAERQKWFRKKAQKIAEAVDGDFIVWESIARNSPFSSTRQAKEWILSHLPEWRQSNEA